MAEKIEEKEVLESTDAEVDIYESGNKLAEKFTNYNCDFIICVIPRKESLKKGKLAYVSFDIKSGDFDSNINDVLKSYSNYRLVDLSKFPEE